jgi:hypothetical protein
MGAGRVGTVVLEKGQNVVSIWWNGGMIRSSGRVFMLRPRLLVVVTLCLGCAMFGFGQSQQGVASSANDSSLNSSANSFSFLPNIDLVNPDFKSDADNGSTVHKDDPIKANSFSRKQLIELLDAEQNGVHFNPHSSVSSDRDCLYIYSILMVRDSPQSDSTHYAGSTTCVPSARFRLHTTENPER